MLPLKKIEIIHHGSLTWNLPIRHLEREMIFQTSMIMFHVNLQGCRCCFFWWFWVEKKTSQDLAPKGNQLGTDPVPTHSKLASLFFLVAGGRLGVESLPTSKCSYQKQTWSASSDHPCDKPSVLNIRWTWHSALYYITWHNNIAPMQQKLCSMTNILHDLSYLFGDRHLDTWQMTTKQVRPCSTNVEMTEHSGNGIFRFSALSG